MLSWTRRSLGLTCLQCCKGFNDVIIQSIHESLLLLASVVIAMGFRTPFRTCKRVPLSKLSLTFSHAALVVVGSTRGSNEASTLFALRWSLRSESILREKEMSRDTW